MIKKKSREYSRYHVIETSRYLLNKFRKYNQERGFILKILINLINIIRLSLLLIIKKGLKRIIKYL